MQNNRPVYVAPPGLSFTSIFLNLPCVMGQASGPKPLIFLDEHDYTQLRGAALEEGSDNPKAPYLLTACDSLRQRGVIQVIDYTAYYPSTQQENYIRQNRELLKAASTEVNQQVAVKGDDEWIDYARGEYQESLRAGLGEDVTAFCDHRRAEKNQHRKMQRGLGDPVEWNQKVLDKGVAALAVCQGIQRHLDVNVCGVVASSQYHAIGELLAAAQPRRQKKSAIDGFDRGHDRIDTEATHLHELKPKQRIEGLNPTESERIRDILDTVTEVGMDVAGGQHHDWTILGPTLAIPHFDTMFDVEWIRMEIQRTDIDSLAEESKRAITELEKARDSAVTAGKCQYNAEWIVEQNGSSHSARKTSLQELAGTVNRAADFSQYSGELRSMVNENSVSQAAAFIAASALSDPVRHYDRNNTYRRSIRLRNRLNPPSLGENELSEIQKERRGATWTEHEDWYETLDRQRLTGSA